ncbi:hypothetical protein EJ03DRAFT_349968 [Teratosphaeria nubilosa]|uniref:Uncharacterized protein n=1 Tax=Teratosphaeria nubilosa TaxID=161662 RepID=A0A6G1LDH9_9PEZI|nr:hypothetical protein EJ03DRAFT_349968 [Teratosphaeria nubilosa]
MNEWDGEGEGGSEDEWDGEGEDESEDDFNFPPGGSTGNNASGAANVPHRPVFGPERPPHMRQATATSANVLPPSDEPGHLPSAASTGSGLETSTAASVVGESKFQICETMRTCSLHDFRVLVRFIEAGGRNIDCEDLEDDASLERLRGRMVRDMAWDRGVGATQN